MANEIKLAQQVTAISEERRHDLINTTEIKLSVLVDSILWKNSDVVEKMGIIKKTIHECDTIYKAQ